MVCPVCGVECRDVKVCPECGWDLGLSVGEMIPERLVGRYVGLDGYWDVGYRTLTIHKDGVCGQVERVIDHRDIAGILFQPASLEGNGYAVIRERGEVWLSINDELDASCYELALVFLASKEKEFAELCAFLEHIRGTIPIRKSEAQKVSCPRCGSDLLRNRCVYVPVFIRKKDEFRLSA
ncbi:MAG: hypothetical protein IJW45_08205 [Oscillospiraceae bacterium]|nr:hypothetical protein [Oscillospiraceae bacterium]